jgi:predicted nuclease of predicted toxin-antitoxin system
VRDSWQQFSHETVVVRPEHLPASGGKLADIYPNSVHVSAIGLGKALDIEIWQYARDNHYMIVTKDADFSEFGLLKGFPPKIIWIRRGNCSTQEMETILRENFTAISILSENEDLGILTLF